MQIVFRSVFVHSVWSSPRCQVCRSGWVWVCVWVCGCKGVWMWGCWCVGVRLGVQSAPINTRCDDTRSSAETRGVRAISACPRRSHVGSEEENSFWRQTGLNSSCNLATTSSLRLTPNRKNSELRLFHCVPVPQNWSCKSRNARGEVGRLEFTFWGLNHCYSRTINKY